MTINKLIKNQLTQNLQTSTNLKVNQTPTHPETTPNTDIQKLHQTPTYTETTLNLDPLRNYMEHSFIQKLH